MTDTTRTEEETLLLDTAREAFRLRHNTNMQLSNLGNQALNFVSKNDPSLHEAALQLFGTSEEGRHAMGLWFVTPNAKTGRSPLQVYNDGKATEVKTEIAWRQALKMM